MLVKYINDDVFKHHKDTLYLPFKELIDKHERGIDILDRETLFNCRQNIIEWQFLDNIKSTDEYKKYVLTNKFWANSWAISLIENDINLKFILLDS